MARRTILQTETDLEIIERVKGGQKAAFSKLVERHQRGLLRLCLRFLGDLQSAEDVVQESFVKAFKKLNMFEGRSSFKSWLFQIAANTSKNRLRSRRMHLVDIEDTNLSVAATARQNIEVRDLKQVLRKEVDKLPERQRKALILRIYEDLSFREIAQIMECPYDTAKANYRHGLLKLRSSTVFAGRKDLLSSFEEESQTEVRT